MKIAVGGFWSFICARFSYFVYNKMSFNYWELNKFRTAHSMRPKSRHTKSPSSLVYWPFHIHPQQWRCTAYTYAVVCRCKLYTLQPVIIIIRSNLWHPGFITHFQLYVCMWVFLPAAVYKIPILHAHCKYTTDIKYKIQTHNYSHFLASSPSACSNSSTTSIG